MGSKSAAHRKPRVRRAAVSEYPRPVGVSVEQALGDKYRAHLELDGHQQHTAMPSGVAHETAETILTNAGEGFFALDADGRFTYINPQAEWVIQHSAQDVLGRVIWDVLPREMSLAVQGPYERARVHGVVASFEGQCPTRKKWVAGRVQPTRTGGLGVYLRAFTTEKRIQLELQESDERFRATFEQAPIGIAHLAADGQWLRVNRRLCEILGFSREVLLAQTFEGAMRQADLALDLGQIELALRDKIWSYDLERRFVRGDGERAWCHLSVSLLRDSDQTPKYFIVMIEDISARKAVDDVLGATAHELRLPISHVKGFVSSLLRTDMAWQDDIRRDFLAEIEHETDRMSHLVDDILDRARLSSTGQSHTQRSTTTPAALIAGGLRRVRPDLASRSVEIDVSAGLPQLEADVPAVERVLANLLDNANKYSPPHACVSVSAGLVDGMLELCVDDAGPGVPAEDRERIFQPFYRRDAGGRLQLPGHGLGLPICRSIVAAHAGHIRVVDRPGGGARFIVALPLAPVQRFPKAMAASY
jgi:PAS domain S-box-containing protein